MTSLRAWDRSLEEPVHPRPLALLRIASGALVVLHLRPFLAAASAGTIYSDTFYLPYAPWYPELPRSLYVGVLWATVAAAVLLGAGLFTRVAAWGTAGGVAYNLFLSQTHFHHNRAFLVILLAGLAVLPSGGALSLDRAMSRRGWTVLGRGRRLSLAVLRFAIAAVYLASGISKAVDPDWWGGVVTRIRVEQHTDLLAARGVPGAVLDLLVSPAFQGWAAKAIVLTELFIGAGLLWRRTRLAAVWVAIPFHLAIEATASVQVFSWAALAALVVWVSPVPADRTVETTGWRARSIRLLDWAGRFRIDSPDAAGSLQVRDRDGSVVEGARARWLVLSRLPLTFSVAAPVLAAGSVARRLRAGRAR